MGHLERSETPWKILCEVIESAGLIVHIYLAYLTFYSFVRT